MTLEAALATMKSSMAEIRASVSEAQVALMSVVPANKAEADTITEVMNGLNGITSNALRLESK